MANCWAVWIVAESENTVVLPALAAGTRLDILVEAMGRVNFDVAIHDRKGITDKVELISDTGRQELEDWQVYSFPVDYAFVQDKSMQRETNSTDRLITGLLSSWMKSETCSSTCRPGEKAWFG
ncbi:MAG: hypothetical protein ACLR6J_09845 [Parabacteroides merdae]